MLSRRTYAWTENGRTHRAWMDKWLDGALRRHDYRYDAADQILDVKREGQPLFAFEHDDDGNMTFKGDLITGRTDVYEWNSIGCLRRILVQEPDGMDTEVHNDYDYEHIRRRKRERVGQHVSLTDYFYSGLPVVGESRSLNSESPEDTSFFTAHQVLGFARAGWSYYFLADSLGSVVDLVTDAGHVIASHAQQEFGEGQPHFIGSHGLIPERDLLYIRHRWYMSSIGRFMSHDPVAALNEYVYSMQNPVTLADMTGAAPERPQKYKSPHAAAVAAFRRHSGNGLTRYANMTRREYVGFIYQTRSGEYAFTGSVMGPLPRSASPSSAGYISDVPRHQMQRLARFTADNCPEFRRLIAVYHNHPLTGQSEIDRRNELVSPADIDHAFPDEMGVYMLAPSGAINFVPYNSAVSPGWNTWDFMDQVRYIERAQRVVAP